MFLTLLIVSFNFSFATVNEEVKGGLTWYTDLAKAQEASEKSNKPIFGFFTGSDWCGWCKMLQRNVFVKESFIAWAKENVILLELDFPKKVQQSAELRTQNRNLATALGVRGYPTVWLFTASVNPEDGGYHLTRMGKLGYPRAEKGKEAEKFLSDANAILAAVENTAN